MAFRQLPTCALLLCVAAATGVSARGARAGDLQRVELEGVKAVVRAPEGWERAAQTPAAGEWRVVFRGPKLAQGGAQCEARVFPVQGTEEAASVLMQAADQISRQVGGEGFGVPQLRSFRLEGRPAAEAQLVVQAGHVRLEGALRLLRAAGTAWALAWGLAPADAPAAVREVAGGFASSLVPSEPAFYGPAPPLGDPEEAITAPPGEEPVRRRHIEAVIGSLEAGAGLRLPRNARAEIATTLREDALHGGAAARAGYRDTARALHEGQGLPPEEQLLLRASIGRRILEALNKRQESGYAPAQRLALIFALGQRPGAGTAEAGLTRFEVEIVIEGLAFLAALAADLAVEPDATQRAALGGARPRGARDPEALPERGARPACRLADGHPQPALRPARGGRGPAAPASRPAGERAPRAPRGSQGPARLPGREHPFARGPARGPRERAAGSAPAPGGPAACAPAGQVASLPRRRPRCARSRCCSLWPSFCLPAATKASSSRWCFPTVP